MRVLLVSHLFPPAHSAGTEVYTAELGARLQARGHAVYVFATDKDIGLPDLSLRERSHAGLPVFELVNNLFYEEFADTWRNPEIERRFAEVLDRVRPDVVHFQHLLYLSVGCLAEASRRGLPVLFTLHDFWLECPRMGQLVHGDGSICETVDHARCGTCLPSFKWRQTELERKTGRAIARVQSATGVDLGPLARGARRLVQEFKSGMEEAAEPTEPATEAAAPYESAARERAAALRTAALAHVDRFVSPSRFLRDRFVAWGIPEERILHLPTGIDADAFSGVARPPREAGSPLRVAFLGSLVPLKGAHVLVEAWGELSARERALGELALYGPSDHAPEYVAGLRARAAEVGADLAGPLTREEVPKVLAATDLLVVPSVWFENRPLIVLEALAARTPLCVSDFGGMVELVEEGVTGWRFPVGDAAALAVRLRELLLEPTNLEGLYRSGPRLPSWEQMTEATIALYEEVAREKNYTG